MSTRTISRDQSRRLDERAVGRYGMISIMLMENAARGVADLLQSLGIDGPTAICCGAGNNGGDGYALARHLDLRGHKVRLVALADPAKLTGDAATNRRIAELAGLQIHRPDAAQLAEVLRGCHWIVDALLGTGARGNPRSPLAEAIQAINHSRIPVLAIDVPSGLDCDTGAAGQPTIVAAHTCTFVAAKPGFLEASASRFTGKVHVLDIGAPRALVEEILNEPQL